MYDAAVGQDDVLLEHVIDGLAIEHRPGAGGVVGHHPAERGPACRRDVRRKAKAVLPERRVQIVEHDARLDARPSLFSIQFQEAVEVLRGIDDHPAPDCLTRLRRPPTPHRQRASVLAAYPDDAADVLPGLDEDDARRRDLVDAGVRCIERARDGVEAHLALDLALQLAAKRVHVDAGVWHARKLSR